MEYLLDLPTMDVNFRNSQGATLVMTLSGATLSKSSKMIEYLIKVIKIIHFFQKNHYT